ncbi:MAG: GAF domain-containing protein, partial [Chloroflexota bacterium]
MGLPILALGLLVPGRLVVPATVPALDAASLLCVLVTAAVAAIDALIRADRRSLPTASIGVALAVIWAGHLVIFPGNLPAIDQAFASTAASSVFLAGNLATPLMLAVALLQGGGSLAKPGRTVAVALAAGLAAGAVVVGAALLLAPVFPTITATGQFNETEALAGAAGLVPALVGLGVYLAGWRGDERASSGVAAALALAACNSIVLFFLEQRYTTAWYADHVLAFLVTAALLTGQVAIFADALRRETRNAASLRTSLEMTEAMARQVELDPLIERLMAGAMNAVRADRATLMAVDGDDLQVQASIDRRGGAAPLGRRLPKASMRADGIAVVEEAIRRRRAIATGPYDRDLLAPDHAAGIVGLRHYITWPLVLGDEVDAVLVLARRRDDPFDAEDAALLSEFATIAALLLRNAHLLGAAEAASVAKGNFLNMAAHEL